MKFHRQVEMSSDILGCHVLTSPSVMSKSSCSCLQFGFEFRQEQSKQHPNIWTHKREITNGFIDKFFKRGRQLEMDSPMKNYQRFH